MISQIKQKGFTIVELLIVIVIIAILAAISIAAYTNITARANSSSAQAAAKAARDTLQNFQGAHGAWPANKAALVRGAPSTSATDMANAVSKLPSDITFDTVDNVGTTTNPKVIAVVPHGTPVAGYTIHWRNFSGSPSVDTMTVGDTTGGAGVAMAD